LPPGQLNNNDKQIIAVFIIVGSISRSANVSEEGEEVYLPTNVFTLYSFFLRCNILRLLCIFEFTQFNVPTAEHDEGKSNNYAEREYGVSILVQHGEDDRWH
jgi:hypothetical protein